MVVLENSQETAQCQLRFLILLGYIGIGRFSITRPAALPSLQACAQVLKNPIKPGWILLFFSFFSLW